MHTYVHNQGVASTIVSNNVRVFNAQVVNLVMPTYQSIQYGGVRFNFNRMAL